MEDFEKKYNEALKRAKAVIDVAANKEEAEGYAFTIFPELRESEDERVRKWLIQYIKDTHPIANYWNGAPTISDVLSWLEKQKEQVTDESDKIAAAYQLGRSDERKQKEQKPAWSEEDEKKIHFLSRLIEFQVKDGEYCFGEGSCAISKQEAIEMLQSLRPSWKPSEEQMNYLCAAVMEAKRKHNESVNGYPRYAGLKSLHEDLEKRM